MSTELSFNLEKMEVKLQDQVAHYYLNKGQELLYMNDLVGKTIKLSYQKEIHCTHCGKKTNKSYGGGYCYPCTIKLPECDMCILKPELCHYSKGTCRDSKWGDEHCNKPHYVYLANSSGLKVGITRETQIPTRFIDQGAIAALPILKVHSRHQSGIIEKLIASEYKDKTDWRKMLKGEIVDIDLESERDQLFEMFGAELDQFESDWGISILDKESPITINYPVLKYPATVSSLSFEKLETIEGQLNGIKGQYLIFDKGVINLRSFTGYKIVVSS